MVETHLSRSSFVVLRNSVWLSGQKLLDCQTLTQKVFKDCSCGSYQCSFISIITNVTTIILAYKCALYLSPARRSTFLSL